MKINTSKWRKRFEPSNELSHKISYELSEALLIALALFCLLYSVYIAIKYANQIPLDSYSFRQTQTALTAYWLVKNGFNFAYETPVAGPPWSIPFEFPLYQYIVATISQFTNYSLDAIGRVVSYLFLVACLVPVRAITRNLSLSSSSFYIFVALLLSSPIYLYWGRTFMIETTAVFFSIAAIKYFVDIVQGRSSTKYTLLFIIFMTIGILQKATTGLPVLAVMGLVYFSLTIKDLTSRFDGRGIFLVKKISMAIVYFGVPLTIGIIWTLYTDQIKTLNGLGVSLTSSALSSWNWGKLSQRLSGDLYTIVIWQRMFEQNLSGMIGIAILLFGMFSNASRLVKSIIFISVLMGLLPIFLFSNLHLVHTYYQAGNLVFLIYATSVAMGQGVGNRSVKRPVLLVLTIMMVSSNYYYFSKGNLNIIQTEYSKSDSRDLAVSEILRKEVPQEKYFVAFGNDWSSSFAYLSERKSFTVPGFFRQYEKIALNPERFIEESRLGGVVLCPDIGRPTINDLIQWSSTNRHWKIGQAKSCYIAVPEGVSVGSIAKSVATECQGNLEYADFPQAANRNIFMVAGWTTVSGETGIVPEKVYVSLVKENDAPIHFEALQVNRPDVNNHFGQPNHSDSGFSRLIDTTSLKGRYVVGVTRLNRGKFEACQFKMEVSING